MRKIGARSPVHAQVLVLHALQEVRVLHVQALVHISAFPLFFPLVWRLEQVPVYCLQLSVRLAIGLVLH